MEEFNPNRKDYDPRMHSAEHILNQTMIRMFDCGRTINAHIEAKKSRIDFRLEHCPSSEQISEIERRVNEIIQSDLSPGKKLRRPSHSHVFQTMREIPFASSESETTMPVPAAGRMSRLPGRSGHSR